MTPIQNIVTPNLPTLPTAVIPTVLVLLDRLGEAMDRRDGEAAVQLVQLLRQVAGAEWADALLSFLLRRGLCRLASRGGA